MEALLIIIGGLLILAFFSYVLTRGKLEILHRAIFIANQETKFIEKMEQWEEKSNHSGFNPGIDPHDVLSNLNDANYRGKISLDKELKRYGNIQQL